MPWFRANATWSRSCLPLAANPSKLPPSCDPILWSIRVVALNHRMLPPPPPHLRASLPLVVTRASFISGIYTVNNVSQIGKPHQTLVLLPFLLLPCVVISFHLKWILLLVPWSPILSLLDVEMEQSICMTHAKYDDDEINPTTLLMLLLLLLR